MDHSGKTMYGHNGGVWEWTSTPLRGYEGFVPSDLYPGYSADFFDDKHFVVVRPLSSFSFECIRAWLIRVQIGGSYATIPQIASRQSFRNWYQANYPYSFIGGRVAYDV